MAPSKNPTNAPVLDLDSAVWLAEKDDVTRFLEDMSTRFLEFLKRNEHWKGKYNHNHLRISRALDNVQNGVHALLSKPGRHYGERVHLGTERALTRLQIAIDVL